GRASALLFRAPPGARSAARPVDALVGRQRQEAADGLHQIGLVGHDLVEVLVGTRHLVEDRLAAGGEHLPPAAVIRSSCCCSESSRRAWPRLITRPAPWLHDANASGLPSPRPRYDPVP